MADFNPFDPAFLEDPYPFYRLLREEDPVHRHPMGFYVLTRYEDVAGLLRDPRFGKSAYQELLAARIGSTGGDGPWLTASMLFKDPPDHTRLRSLVSRAFTPRVVETMRGHVQEIVDRLLDRVLPTGRMDVIEDLAYPLPVTVISEMLGVPGADGDQIRGWSRDVARSLDAIAFPVAHELMERGNAAHRGLAGYFTDLAAERRRRPGPDLLSGLLAAEEQGDRLSPKELLATCILLYIAGHETTVNLIGNGMLALLRQPAELRRLAEQPALLPGAVEELLRYDGPVQRTGRIASVDVEIDGTAIPRGTLVLGLLGAANRDPAVFAEPDRLDLGRAENRHIAFGHGLHFCLGASLARLEGQVAFGAILRRCPGLALDPDAGPVAWRPSATLRGLEALPVTFDAPA